MTIELDTTLAQAEVLFLSFSQIVADIDRRKAEHASNTTNVLRRRSASATPATDLSVLEISENLRNILKIHS